MGDEFNEFSVETFEHRFVQSKAVEAIGKATQPLFFFLNFFFLNLLKKDLSKRNPIYTLFESNFVYEALLMFIHANVHRIAIHDKHDVSKLKMENILSQSTLIAFIYSHADKLGNCLDVQLKDKAVLKPVITVKQTDQAIVAFKKILSEKVSAVAVVDDEDRFVSAISSKDIKILVNSKKKNRFEPKIKLFLSCLK